MKMFTGGVTDGALSTIGVLAINIGISTAIWTFVDKHHKLVSMPVARFFFGKTVCY